MRTVSTRKQRSPRRGISVLWLLLTMPIFLTLLVYSVHLGNLWVARVELENALESSALAAVQEWGQAGGGLTGPARLIGVSYAAANPVRDFAPIIDDNLDPSPAPTNPNANEFCQMGADPASGNLIFGAIIEDPVTGELTFDAGTAPSCMAFGGYLTAEGTQGDLATCNGWRVHFPITDPAWPNVSITKIVLDISAGAGTSGKFADSDIGGHTFECFEDANSDGFEDVPVSEITHTFIDPNGGGSFKPTVLEIDVVPGEFVQEESLYFGVGLAGIGGGNTGEVVGDIPTHVTIHYTVPASGGGTEEVTASTYFTNDPEDGLAFSWANLDNTAGQGAFGVRAQAIIPVPSPCLRVPCMSTEQRYIQGSVFAMYDCDTGSPRLVRIDRFICPGPDTP